MITYYLEKRGNIFMTILKNEFLISIKKNEALKKSAKQVILMDVLWI